MISGETESILRLTEGEPHDLYYDEFLGIGKKQKAARTLNEVLARKQKRKKFWTGVEDRIKDSGGLEGLTRSLGNAYANLKSPGAAINNSPIDFQAGFPGAYPTRPKSDHTLTFVLIGTGLLVTGLALYGYLASEKKTL